MSSSRALTPASVAKLPVRGQNVSRRLRGEPLGAAGAQVAEAAQPGGGRGQRRPQAGVCDRPLQHRRRDLRGLTVGDQRRLERRRQSLHGLRRRARRQARGEASLVLVRVESEDVLVVEPVQLRLVEHGGAGREPGKIELGDQPLQRHDLLVAVRPGEQGEVVGDRLRQIAELAVVPDGGGAVALGELAAVGSQDERVVSVSWRRALEGGEQHQLPRRVGEVVVAADDVRDAHVAIVDGGGEVVGRQTVGAHDDEVADDVGGEGDPAADEVVDAHLAVRDTEPDGGRLAGRHPALHLFRRQPQAAAVVERHAALRQTLGAQLLETRLAAEAVVGLAGAHELVGGLDVARQTLTLPVRAVRAATVGALVPGEAQPRHVVEDGGLVAGVGARRVGVFDAQHEDTAMVAREQVVEQRRARRADVQRTCGARRETDSRPRVKRDGPALLGRGRPANPREVYHRARERQAAAARRMCW